MRCIIPLIPKIASAHTRLILNWSKNGMKNRHKKTAVPNNVHFGIAVVRYYSIVRSAAQNARRKMFMLRKWQHRQVAPLAIQTPNKCGLCIGCAVLPAQRGTSRLSPRSVLLPSAEVSAGHPHPSETSPESRAYALEKQGFCWVVCRSLDIICLHFSFATLKTGSVIQKLNI